ncbi:MAG: calcium/sodium antiporter [Bryobacterales bacterium]|nr:calcium/sodium antiporter [Bryobacterales bacterium]
MTFLLLLLGLVLLFLGGELLVRGASNLATSMGISRLVVGLTVVAFSTSAPELAVSLQSALEGQSAVAVGNVVGSNISNILLILGASALVAPLIVARQIVRIDVPMMIASAGLGYAMSLDGTVSRADGLAMMGMLAAYLWMSIRLARQQTEESEPAAARRPMKDAFLVVAGVGMLVMGANWLVDGAVVIARQFGISELIIGLTVVAVGTSLPELATSIIATRRGEREIAVGNIVGSNIFNVLAVLGMTAVLAPGGVPVPTAALAFDYPVMMAASLACLPIFLRRLEIARWEGALFFGYYVAYTLYLLLDATGHDALPYYSGLMLWFVLPLTAITFLTILYRETRRNATAP